MTVIANIAGREAGGGTRAEEGVKGSKETGHDKRGEEGGKGAALVGALLHGQAAPRSIVPLEMDGVWFVIK
jgi:hypothetical protein